MRVIALASILALAGGFTWFAVIDSATAITRPVDVPWWVLAGIVAVAETAVIHVRFERDARSFSLSEVALVERHLVGVVVVGRDVVGRHLVRRHVERRRMARRRLALNR